MRPCTTRVVLKHTHSFSDINFLLCFIVHYYPLVHYAQIHQQRILSDCGSNCVTCATATTCTTCKDGYGLTAEGTCAACGEFCSACLADANACTSCDARTVVNGEGVCQGKPTILLVYQCIGEYQFDVSAVLSSSRIWLGNVTSDESVCLVGH